MQTARDHSGRAVIGLLVVAVMWGSSFPLTRVVLAEVPTGDFLAIRFAIATAVCGGLFFGQLRRLDRRDLGRGIVMGLLYGTGQLLQTQGLVTTPASVSGFITGLYVVLTPICAWVLLRTAIGARVWVGAVLATIGLALLSLNGSLGIGSGELLTAASALVYALHIVALSSWARPDRALAQSVVQMAVMTVMGFAVAVPDGITLPHSPGVWAALLYLALFSGGLALVVQVWAQAHLPASRAAIVMSTEPLWAAIISVGFFAESLTWRLVVGGAAMLSAMLLVEVGPRVRWRPGEPRDGADLLGEDLGAPPR